MNEEFTPMEEYEISSYSDRTSDRTRVIKLLQEQIKDLLVYKTEYENMKMRATLAEQALQVKEAQFKLQLDEIQSQQEELQKDNQQLRKAVTRLPTTQKPEIAAGNEIELQAKINKWKMKYHALANADPNAGAVAQVQSLESKISTLQSELEQSKSALEDQKAETSQYSQQLSSAGELIKKQKAALAEAQQAIQHFQEEKSQMNSKIEQLTSELEKKSGLLKHTRKQQEKKQRSQHRAEETIANQLKAKTELANSQASEISRLSEEVEREKRKVKKAERRAFLMSKDYEEKQRTLTMSLDKAHADKVTLQKQLDQAEESTYSLESENQSLREEKKELERVASKVAKTKQQNIHLESTVNQLQSTIDELQSSISSFQTDSSARSDELRGVLQMNFTGIDPSLSWEESIEIVKSKFADFKEAVSMNNKLMARLKRAKKEQSQLSASSQSSLEQLEETNQALQQKLNTAQTKIKEMEGDPKQIAFARSVRRKADQAWMDSIKQLIQIRQSLDENVSSIRPCILAVVFSIRFMHYKKDAPFDGSTILNYVPSGHQTVKPVSSYITNLLSEISDSKSMIEKQKDEKQQLSQKITELGDELKQARLECNTVSTQLSALQENYNAVNEEKSTMVSGREHESIQRTLRNQLDENKELHEQITSLQSDLEKLRLVTDQSIVDQKELQKHADETMTENTELQNKLQQAEKEIHVLQVALKDKTRELLALERRLLKQKTQVVVVKEPAREMSDNSSCASASSGQEKDNFYLTESLRDGLAQMQSRIMKKDIVV